jgi:hypothetical protein
VILEHETYLSAKHKHEIVIYFGKASGPANLRFEWKGTKQDTFTTDLTIPFQPYLADRVADVAECELPMADEGRCDWNCTYPYIGQGKTQCVNGAWTSIGDCVKPCFDAPDLPEGATRIGDCTLPATSGTVCKFTCLGFDNEVRCEDGQWSSAGCGPFQIVEGPERVGDCEYTPSCVTSPKYPKPAEGTCEIKVTTPAVIGAEGESSANFTIAGVEHASVPNEIFVAEGKMLYWQQEGLGEPWRMCARLSRPCLEERLPPTNGTLRHCPFPLPSGESCQYDCFPSMAGPGGRLLCVDGSLQPQTLQDGEWHPGGLGCENPCRTSPVLPPGAELGECTLPKLSGQTCPMSCHGYRNEVHCYNGDWLPAACGPFVVTHGQCEYVNDCVANPDWPQPARPSRDSCEIRLRMSAYISSVGTEDPFSGPFLNGFDNVTIGGKNFFGGAKPCGVHATDREVIRWDRARTGDTWMLCAREALTCERPVSPPNSVVECEGPVMSGYSCTFRCEYPNVGPGGQMTCLDGEYIIEGECHKPCAKRPKLPSDWGWWQGKKVKLPVLHGKTYQYLCAGYRNEVMCEDGEWKTPPCGPLYLIDGACDVDGACVKSPGWPGTGSGVCVIGVSNPATLGAYDSNLGVDGELIFPNQTYTEPFMLRSVRVSGWNSTLIWRGGNGAQWKICAWAGCAKLPRPNAPIGHAVRPSATVVDCKAPLTSGEECGLSCPAGNGTLLCENGGFVASGACPLDCNEEPPYVDYASPVLNCTLPASHGDTFAFAWAPGFREL